MDSNYGVGDVLFCMHTSFITCSRREMNSCGRLTVLEVSRRRRWWERRRLFDSTRGEYLSKNLYFYLPEKSAPGVNFVPKNLYFSTCQKNQHLG
jgi:hypothetical protein